MSVVFEPLSRCWRENPYPVYRQLRDHDPVHWALEAGMFCISRYEDVSRVLADPERFSSAAMNDVPTDRTRGLQPFIEPAEGFLGD